MIYLHYAVVFCRLLVIFQHLQNTIWTTKTEFENDLIENINDETVLEMHIADYLNLIHYETPSHKTFDDEKKKLKQLYYYK